MAVGVHRKFMYQNGSRDVISCKERDSAWHYG